MDIFETSLWLQPALAQEPDLDQDQALNDYFNQAGYNSMMIIMNLASTLIYLWILILAFTTYGILGMLAYFFNS